LVTTRCERSDLRESATLEDRVNGRRLTALCEICHHFTNAYKIVRASKCLGTGWTLLARYRHTTGGVAQIVRYRGQPVSACTNTFESPTRTFCKRSSCSNLRGVVSLLRLQNCPCLITRVHFRAIQQVAMESKCDATFTSC
jgi:hypothetical protein